MLASTLDFTILLLSCIWVVFSTNQSLITNYFCYLVLLAVMYKSRVYCIVVNIYPVRPESPTFYDIFFSLF